MDLYSQIVFYLNSLKQQIHLNKAINGGETDMLITYLTPNWPAG